MTNCRVTRRQEAGGIGNKVVNNFLATILGLVRQCPTLSDRVGGVMNLLLLTQEEAALAGRPAGKTPNTKIQTPKEDEDTEGGGLEAAKVGRWEEEKRSEGLGSEGPMTQVQDRTQSGLDRVSPQPGGEEEFLRLLFEFTHSVQLNPDRTIALAAKRWERTLRFRLAVTRQRRWGGRDGGKVGSSRKARCATRSGGRSADSNQ